MAEESWLTEKAGGALGGISAIVLFLIAAAAGPRVIGTEFGCPIYTPAPPLCAMPWSYQTANAARRVAYALVGFVVLAVGSFLISLPMIMRRGYAAMESPPRGRAERRLGVAIVVLALVSIALLFAAVAVGFTTPPTRTLTFTNSQLLSVGTSLTASYGTARAATVYLTAGEAITATYTVAWYANGSTAPEYGGGFPPTIVPAGQPLNGTGPWTTWYIVPQTGAYVIWFFAELPFGSGPFTSNATMTVTAYNVDLPPTIQLALTSLGGAVFASAVVVDWIARPRGTARGRRSCARGG